MSPSAAFVSENIPELEIFWLSRTATQQIVPFRLNPFFAGVGRDQTESLDRFDSSSPSYHSFIPIPI